MKVVISHSRGQRATQIRCRSPCKARKASRRRCGAGGAGRAAHAAVQLAVWDRLKCTCALIAAFTR